MSLAQGVAAQDVFSHWFCLPSLSVLRDAASVAQMGRIAIGFLVRNTPADFASLHPGCGLKQLTALHSGSREAAVRNP